MSLQTIIDDITAALEPIQQEIPDLQISGFWNDQPSPPCLDVYPGIPFQDGTGFYPGQNKLFFTVRARVAMADPEAGQQLLLRMLDGDDAASIETALAVADVAVVPEGVSGFTQYADDTSAHERMLGCEWRVTAFS